METKKNYELPELTLTKTFAKDIITASPGTPEIGDNDSSNDGEWD